MKRLFRAVGRRMMFVSIILLLVTAWHLHSTLLWIAIAGLVLGWRLNRVGNHKSRSQPASAEPIFEVVDEDTYHDGWPYERQIRAALDGKPILY